MVYRSPPIGNEISAIMYGIDKSLKNEDLEGILFEGLRKDNFKIIDRLSHEFSPQGFTKMIPVKNLMHIVIHTYPEYNSLYLNIYNSLDEEEGIDSFNYVRKHLDPLHVDFTRKLIVLKYGEVPIIGNEISGVMYDIKDKIIRDNKKLEEILEKSLDRGKFKKLKNEYIDFSKLLILVESHAIFYSSKKLNSAFFHLYTCRGPEDGRKTYEFIKEKLKPRFIDVRERPVKVDKNLVF